MRHSATAAGAVAVALLSAPAASAQDTFTFAFSPAAGAVVRTLTELRTVTTFTGFPAVPDGSTLEEERRVEGRHRAVGQESGMWLVEAVIDTVWSRRRLDQGAWRDVADSVPSRRPATALVSSQFAVVGFRTAGPADAEIYRPVGAMVAGLDFAFPGEPVTVGQPFPTGGRVQLRIRAAAETGVAVDETVFGDLVLTLDSVVRQDADELAYVRLGGALAPRTTSQQGEGGSSAGSFTGAFVGRLIWSRRWSAFVSGVARIRVEGRITAETPRGLVAASAVWDATVRHQVRP